MIKQNLTEYEFIREEMNALRTCITTYMGFVIGGSSIAYFGTAALTEAKDISGNTIIAFFISSLIVSMVLTILFYKFNSHNRYSGYCKLLNQENICTNKETEQFFSWEVCMDVLREIDDHDDLVKEKIEQIKKDKYFRQFLKNNNRMILNNEKDKSRIRKIAIGFGLLLGTFIGIARPRSWIFPLYVTAAFFTIVVLFILTGLYYCLMKPELANFTLLVISCSAISIIQIFMWSQIFKKLYDLMYGNRTIEAYCWRFLPIRYDYIKKCDPDSGYSLITLK